MLGWFGDPYPSTSEPAPIYKETPRIRTPEGRLCIFCREKIRRGDRGFVSDTRDVSHHECYIMSIFGPAPDTDNLTHRGRALISLKYMEMRATQKMEGDEPT